MPLPCISGRYCCAAAGVLLSTSAAGFEPLSSPHLPGAAVPANVVILLDSSSSMAMTAAGEQNRLQAAREAIRQLLRQQRQQRFGLFSFNPSTGHGAARDSAGGRLLVEVADIAPSDTGDRHLQRLEQALDSLAPDTGDNPDRYTWTPLAESHYEISRYLRGMDSFYNVDQPAYDSPLQWRCQPSSAVVVTDGLPTYDDQFPSSPAEEPAGLLSEAAGVFGLPDWDRNAGNDVSGEGLQVPGSTFYLDDMAAFALSLDLRTGGFDAAGVSWDDPLFTRQRMRTHVLGFGVDDPRLRAAARAGGGIYSTVDDAGQLAAALTHMVGQSALPRVLLHREVGGLQLADGASLSMRVYQHRSGWGGEVQFWELSEAGEPVAMVWTTDQAFASGAPPALLQTWRPVAGGVASGAVTLDAAAADRLSAEQQRMLQSAAAQLLPGLTDSVPHLLRWLSGEAVTGLRPRERLLGDPGRPGPRILPAGAALVELDSDGYRRYLRERAQLGDLMLIGSNDGFLHVVEIGGGRRYSYLPASLLPALVDWAAPDYAADQLHRAGVDGQVALADLRQDGVWQTVAATGLGAGGRGLIALRVFGQAPGDAEPGVLWERSASESGWSALGHIYAPPLLIEHAGRSLLLTGNGYGSAIGGAALLVVDATTGELLRQIDLPDRRNSDDANGLSALSLQQGAAGQLVAGFAGDLHGQLWRFELAADDPADWQVGNGGAPLFQAAHDQPLTAAPVLHYSAAAQQDVLLFGSGRLLAQDDPGSGAAQAFYAVRSQSVDVGHVITPADLQAQRVLPGLDPHTRQVSEEAVDWRQQAGWYLPLPVGPRSAERVLAPALVQGGRVVFMTALPLTEARDPCLSGSTGWLMMLMLDDGGMPPFVTLDTDRDQQLDEGDSRIGGIELDVGLPGELQMRRWAADPTLRPPGCEGERYLIGGSHAVAALLARGECRLARIHWRQLQ